MKGDNDMFTLNDLLDQVNCQGKSRVMMIEDGSGDIKEVFKGEELGNLPYWIGSKELAYIYSDGDTTVYEVNE